MGQPTWSYEPPWAAIRAFEFLVVLLWLGALLVAMMLVIAWSRSTRERRDEHDRSLMQLGEARGRQQVLDDVRMLVHGQLKAHVLAVQHCLAQAHAAEDNALRQHWLGEAQAQSGRLLQVVVGLHQSTRLSALPDDLEQTIVDVTRSLAVAYPECACRVEASGLRHAAASAAVQRGLTLVLYNAVQNAFLHAAPTEVIVQLEYAPDAVTLVVADNGNGMAPSVISSAGRGLRDCSQVTEELGGTLALTSTPGLGTTITATIPMPHAPSAT
jgi:signal transduction histidine kinase